MSAIGLVLLVIAAVLAAAEAHVVSFGALGAGAVLAGAGGAALLAAGAGGSAGVIVGAVLAVLLVGGAFGALAARRLLAVRRSPVRGVLTGRVGELRAVPDPVGRVMVDGALWRARAWDDEEAAALQAGDPVVVENVNGLTLTVRRAEEWEVAP